MWISCIVDEKYVIIDLFIPRQCLDDMYAKCEVAEIMTLMTSVDFYREILALVFQDLWSDVQSPISRTGFHAVLFHKVTAELIKNTLLSCIMYCKDNLDHDEGWSQPLKDTLKAIYSEESCSFNSFQSLFSIIGSLALLRGMFDPFLNTIDGF